MALDAINVAIASLDLLFELRIAFPPLVAVAESAIFRESGQEIFCGSIRFETFLCIMWHESNAAR
jgi:hypothetical protein